VPKVEVRLSPSCKLYELEAGGSILLKKKPFKRKMLEGLHPVFLTLWLPLHAPCRAEKQQNAKAGLLASPPF